MRFGFISWFVVFILVLTSVATTLQSAPSSCNENLIKAASNSKLFHESNDEQILEASLSISAQLEEKCSPQQGCQTDFVHKTVFDHLIDTKGKAYAAIAAIMLSSSSVAAVLASLTGESNPALSYFVATFLSQITSLGVYVVGAPFWEPLQSKIRAMAYKATGQHQENDKSHSFLEQQYFRTNRSLSLNAQMSRNVIRDYLKTVTQSLYDAKKAANIGEVDYIAAQIAEVAVRLNILYPDVNPSSKIVLDSVRTAFTNFIDQPESLIQPTLEYTEQLDPSFDYTEIITNWLTPTSSVSI